MYATIAINTSLTLCYYELVLRTLKSSIIFETEDKYIIINQIIFQYRHNLGNCNWYPSTPVPSLSDPAVLVTDLEDVWQFLSSVYFALFFACRLFCLYLEKCGLHVQTQYPNLRCLYVVLYFYQVSIFLPQSLLP